MKNLMLITLATFVLACSPDAPPSSNPAADRVLVNGNILTVDENRPRADALAIAGDRIIAVGTNNEIRKYIGDSTDVIDLRI